MRAPGLWRTLKAWMWLGLLDRWMAGYAGSLALLVRWRCWIAGSLAMLWLCWHRMDAKFARLMVRRGFWFLLTLSSEVKTTMSHAPMGCALRRRKRSAKRIVFFMPLVTCRKR